MHKHLLWVVSVAALAAAACGGGGSSSVKAEDYPSKLAEAECKNLVACGNSPDSATCAESVVLEGNQVETVLADIASGKIMYDASEAGKCLDEYNTSCTFDGFMNGSDSACNHVFSGTVAQGGACFESLECAGGASCTQTDSSCDASTTCCPGTCGAPAPTAVALGGVCQGSSDCAGKAYCKFPDSGMGDSICTALIQTEGTACGDIDACADPMYCDLDFSTFMGVCTTAAASGAMCNKDELLPCTDARDYCDPTSMKCTRKVAVGGACPTDVDCVGFATCVNAVCVAKPSVGDTCVDGQDPACLGTLSCVGGTCTAPAPGTACM